MTARGWDALRNFVHQQAAFLPIARAELSGEYGDLGGADLATDPGSLATALALQQRRDRELAEPLVTALAELLREAAGAVDAMGRDQMEEAMRQCAEELPLALDDLTSGNLPSGARPPQWWENPDWAQRSVDTVMQELLQQALPYGDVLRRHWPQLLLDEGEGGHAGAAAWRRMVEAAEAAGTPQPRKEGARKVGLVTRGAGRECMCRGMESAGVLGYTRAVCLGTSRAARPRLQQARGIIASFRQQLRQTNCHEVA